MLRRSPQPSHLGPALLVAAASLLLCACSEPRETCVLEPGEGESQRLRCPDGSSGTFLPPTSRGAPAVVQGSARRLGDVDASGIEVSLEPTAPERPLYRTLTDAEGRYAFEEVASGTYHLVFREPAYPTLVLWQRTVLPGTLSVDPVVLRPSFKISTIAARDLIVAPSQDALLAFEGEGGRLAFWDETTEESHLLGTSSASPAWSPDGQKVLFLDKVQAGQGNLVRFDRARSTSESIMGSVRRWEVSDDQETIVAERDQNRLSLWSATTRETTTLVPGGLTSWSFHPRSKIVAAHLVSRQGMGTDLLVWDVLAEAGSLFPLAASSVVQFSADGETLLFSTMDGLFLWSRHRRRPERIGTRNDWGTMSPDGRFVAVRTNGGSRLDAYLLDTGAYHPITDARVLDGFDPRTGDLWVVEAVPRRLAIFDGHETSTVGTWTNDRHFIAPYFPRGSEKLYFALRDKSFLYSLHSWTPGRPKRDLASGLASMPILVGDHTHFVLEADRAQLLEIETGRFTELRASAAPWIRLGSHASGLLHYPITPLFHSRPGDIVGPMAVLDLETGEERVFVDEIKQDACAFSEGGALYCLNRRSSIEPRGAELLRWERGGELERLAEGVLGFGFATEGERAWFSSQAVADEVAPLLWLYDPSLPAPVTIDEGISRVALTEGWIAFTIGDGEREGVHVSLYPRSPAGQSP